MSFFLVLMIIDFTKLKRLICDMIITCNIYYLYHTFANKFSALTYQFQAELDANSNS